MVLANPTYLYEYIRYFWQENHQIFGHIPCSYTVLASPTYDFKVVHICEVERCVIKVRILTKVEHVITGDA
jgi:hypothetical protein